MSVCLYIKNKMDSTDSNLTSQGSFWPSPYPYLQHLSLTVKNLALTMYDIVTYLFSPSHRKYKVIYKVATKLLNIR